MRRADHSDSEGRKQRCARNRQRYGWRDGESGVRESGRAGRIVHSGDFPEKPEENVLITAESGGRLDKDAAGRAAAEVTRRMKALSGVESVGEPVASPDGKALLVPVTMKGDTEHADTRVQPLLDAGAAVEKAHQGLRVEQVGTGSTAKGVTETLGEDFEKAELISLPLTLLILLVVFGAVIAAGVPVVLALSCVGAAIGLSTLASHVLPETSAVSNVILLMGMAVGVDCLAAAILLDAVVIRIFVLPALMAVLGTWNWWPGRVSGSGSRRRSHAVPGRNGLAPAHHRE
jgi:putative drug exporter of the RND superfamily